LPSLSVFKLYLFRKMCLISVVRKVGYFVDNTVHFLA